ncbi:tail fiber assembly protein [Aeromonas veronii]|uniref:tail fiber assembly protein n=1 Tax=Aeromonas veronii TaxID=654 RepID=UPI0038D2B2CD
MDRITFLNVRNVTRYTGVEDCLNMEAEFSHLPGQFIPFTARKDDTEEHGREIYIRALFGEFGDIVEVEMAPPSEATQKVLLSEKLRLANTAMAPLEDADKLGIISEREKAQLTAWQRYRVALYRLPQSEGWPTDVIWPDAPQ